MTTIEDVLTYADGSKANGRLAVFWRPFTIGNANVTGGELAYDIVDGAVLVTVYPNAGALPSGTYYSAKYELENGVVYIEQWIVPNLPTVNLGQVRVSFPPTPSILISPTQLTSMNAQPGMFLMWDGVRWVPGYPSTFNLNPNWIGINIGGLGSDVNVEGSPVSVGNYATIHVPDAGPAARGVVTTAAQTIGGPKTFQDRATISQSLLFTQHTVYTSARGELVNIGSGAAHSLNFGGDIVALRIASTDRTRMQADRMVSGSLDLDSIADSPTATMPGSPLSPLKGAETISLPHDGIDWAGIGMAVDGSLWLRTAGAFLYLNANGVTCRELRMDPYQHPNAVGVEASRSDATMVVYSDSTSWGGYGVDNTPELWFRMGPNSGGAYYYFGSGGATFPSLSVTNLSVSGSLIVPPGAGLIPTYWVDGVLAGTRPILNLISGENIGITGLDISDHNRVDITINSGGAAGTIIDPTDTKGDLIVRGADQPAAVTKLGVGTNGQVLTADNNAVTGIKWAVATVASDSSTQRLRISYNGALKGTRQELNLIAGANVTLTVVDVPGNNRVDATVTVATMVTSLTPWSTDIDAAGFKLFGAGRIAIGNSGAVIPDSSTSDFRLLVGSATVINQTAQVNLIGNSVLGGFAVGSVGFANYNLGTTEKRVAAINGGIDLVGGHSGVLDFFVWSVATAQLRMRMNSAGHVGINNDLTVLPGPSNQQHFVVGGSSATLSRITSASIAAVGATAGVFSFANYGISASEKRIAQIQGFTDGALDSGAIVFTTFVAGSGSEKMRITASGNVGIGESNPFSVLSLRGATDPGSLPTATQFSIGEVSNNPAYRLTLGFGVVGGSWTGIIQANNNGAVTGRLSLNPSGGNVGIGLNTSAPLAQLHVLGAGQATGAPNTAGAVGSAIYVQDTGGAAGAGGMVMFGFSAGAFAAIKGYAQNGGANTQGDITFATRRAATDTALTETVRMTWEGKVGISSTGPVQRFEVFGIVYGGPNTTGAAQDGTARIGTAGHGECMDHGIGAGVGWIQARSYVDYANNIKLALNPNGGNVGVGTGNPAHRLHVVGGNFFIQDIANDNSFFINLQDTTSVGFSARNAAYSAVKNLSLQNGGGYVGIGTLAPVTKLDLVTGTLPWNYPQSGAGGFRISTDAWNTAPSLFMGVDGTVPAGWIQAIQAGTTANTLMLNPSGGAVSFGGDINMTAGVGRFGAAAAPVQGGDIGVSRNSSPTTGVVYFGSGGTKYIYFNGTNFDVQAPGGTMTINGVGVSTGGGGVSVQFSGQTPTGPFTFLNFFGFSGVTCSSGGSTSNAITIQISLSSDSQLKRNVESLSGGLPLINQLRPITAEWNGLANTREGERVISVIAQELREVIPDAVTPFRTKLRPGDSEERELLSVNPMAITAHLILAVQQLERRLKVLEGKAN